MGSEQVIKTVVGTRMMNGLRRRDLIKGRNGKAKGGERETGKKRGEKVCRRN